MEESVRILASVADALFPPLKDKALLSIKEGDALSAQLYEYAGGSSDEIMLKALELIETRYTPEGRRDLKFLMRLLGSRWGSALVIGFKGTRWGVPTAFADLPRRQREAILQGWARSPHAKMRKAFKGLRTVIMLSLFGNLSPKGTSLLLEAIRYPIIDPARPPKPIPQAVAAESTVKGSTTDLSPADDSPGGIAAAAAALTGKGLHVVWPDKLRSSSVRSHKPHLVVKCDAVVVGSGAGGGVAAAQLAAAGLRVVVLEKAGFVAAQDMTLREAEAFQSMYENAGIMPSEDGAFSLLAGSTVGGGTRINWCASFKTPPHVRREWAQQLGLTDFESPKYDRALDAVWKRLSVHTGFHHSEMCNALKAGLEGLGVHNDEVPRNCLNADCSGHCGFGCARGYKQDTLNTFLSDACQQGCQLTTGIWADRVITESNRGDGPRCLSGGAPRGKRAVGVLALAGNKVRPLRLVIKAPVVVSSCGSIHTPALLLRSGIRCKGNVGANLRVHPCTVVVGLFPPDPAADAAAMAGEGAATLGRDRSSSPLGDLEDMTPPGGSPAGVASPRRRGSLDGAQQDADGGLEGNGRKLVMSPARHGTGTINCWEGTLMSVFSNHVAHWEEQGYGALLYTPSVHPALFSVAAPWVSGEDFKDLLLQFNNQCTVLVLVRDQGSGRIMIDSRGMPRVHYSIAPADQQSMLEGMELGLRTMASAGAQTVMTVQQAAEARFTFDVQGAGASAAPGTASAGKGRGAADLAQRGPADSAAGAPTGADDGSRAGGVEFEEYLAAVRARGIPVLEMPLLSAHQMGTCRLGVDPRDSVLDPAGECWEVAGLYCLDASAFPTPTGLNPMITIEAIAHMLGADLAEAAVAALKRRGKWKAPPTRQAAVHLGYESASQARL